MNSTGSGDHGSKRPGKDKRISSDQKTHAKESEGRDDVTVKIQISPVSAKDKVGGNSWKAEFAGLENTMRMRHYSDKTPKSYRK